MTDFFKNNPIALRHCLLYQYLQGHNFEFARSNIQCVIGKENINYKRLKFWFNQFSEGKAENKKKEKPIVEILRNDKYALRVCILYESLRYLKDVCSYSVFTNFERFCKVIGDGVIEYREFDFWFYRFLNGKFDLNYEMDKDAKIYELADMPLDVMENIVKYLNIVNRANLAKTSRSLRTFVEDQKLFHRTLRLDISHYMAYVSFSDSMYVKYKNEKECVKVHKTRQTRIPNVSYWKQALLDFTSVLKNPKLHLDNLEIDSSVDNKNLFKNLEEELKFTHHLKVKNLKLREYSSAYLPNIIPFLKPGYLETIRINIKDPKVDSMRRVMETEQWKEAKYFRMKGASFIWSLHNLYHFKEFHIRLMELSVEDIREIKQILFKSPDFAKCWVDTDVIDISIFGQEFGNALRENPYIYHYPLDNSTDYFEIEVKEWSIVITRKKN